MRRARGQLPWGTLATGTVVVMCVSVVFHRCAVWLGVGHESSRRSVTKVHFLRDGRGPCGASQRSKIHGFESQIRLNFSQGTSLQLFLLEGLMIHALLKLQRKPLNFVIRRLIDLTCVRLRNLSEMLEITRVLILLLNFRLTISFGSSPRAFAYSCSPRKSWPRTLRIHSIFGPFSVILARSFYSAERKKSNNVHGGLSGGRQSNVSLQIFHQHRHPQRLQEKKSPCAHPAPPKIDLESQIAELHRNYSELLAAKVSRCQLWLF
jgi:hypothetical protein